MRCLTGSSEHREEWYMHFFTVVYMDRADLLSVYWYKGRTVNRELFEDVRQILERMKEYRICASYTGDIMCLTDERAFVEKLVLLGLQGTMIHTYDWPIQGGGSLEIEGGVCSQSAYFQQMSGVCFQDYDVWHSFSSTDPSEPVLLHKGLARKESVEIVAPSDSESRLIVVSFFGRSVLLSWLPLAITGYTVFYSAIENRQLYTWFVSMIQRQQYGLAKQQIAALEDYHTRQLALSSPLVADTVPSVCINAPTLALTDTVEEVTEVTEAKADVAPSASTTRSLQELESPTFWVRTFCELYVEESADHDTLLSEIYQDYLTFSDWGYRDKLVSMTAFVKTLRALGRFTIKRRSKGMTLVGHRSLVSQQEAMRDAVRHGQQSERNVLRYHTSREIQTIVGRYTDIIEECYPLCAREACLALHDMGLSLDSAILYSFCRIPGMTEQLKMYAEYVDGLLSQPLTMDHQTDYEGFRELTERCVLYYPFRLEGRKFAGAEGAITAPEEASEITLDEQFHGLSLTGVMEEEDSSS